MRLHSMILNPLMMDSDYGIYRLNSDAPYLGGMPYPLETDIWDRLDQIGFTKVVCLTHMKAPYEPSPLEILEASSLEDLYGAAEPDSPEDEERAVRNLAVLIAKAIRGGESVVVHCMGGTGRTGTVLGVTLRELGFTSKKAFEALEKVNNIRGRSGNGWPESPWQKKMVL